MEYAPAAVGPEEAQAVAQAIASGTLSQGERVMAFEAAFQDLLGSPCVALSSCTGALHLALLCHGIGPGDEVITTPTTFCATANAIEHVGATTIFADVAPGTLNIDPAAVEAAITPRTKAIMPVHFAGHPCDMDQLRKIAATHDLTVIEDAAHAFPSKLRGQLIGSRGVACFSFHATKNMTTGEGGLLTGPPEVLQKARLLAVHGMRPEVDWRYDVPVPGWKYNCTDLAAAMGLVQLEKLDAMQRRRKDIWDRYMAALGKEEALQVPEVKPQVEPSMHMFMLRLQPDRLSIDRDRFVELLEEAGVPTSIHFIPLHTFSHYRKKYGHEPEDFPVSWSHHRRMFSIPLHPGLSDEDVEQVVQAVLDVVEKHRA